MSADHDRLRSSLHDLADVAEPVDMYDRAVHRSRRIARREAAVGTSAAVLVLGVLASGLWQLPQHKTADVPTAAAGSHSAVAEQPSSSSAAPPAATATPSRAPETRPAPERSRDKGGRAGKKKKPRPAKPQSRVLSDMTGHVFYSERDSQPDVVRMSPDDGAHEVVLRDAPSSVGISPDGNRVAYVADGTLLVSEAGGEPEPVLAGVVATEQAPVWSPRGDQLLIDATELGSAPGILDVETGTVTALPAGLATGQHFRWSGDGTTLVYATSYCGLKLTTSSTGDDTSTSVPVLGNTQTRDNPDGLAACKPTSVDATGRRVTVPLQTTGESTTGTDTADTIVDTSTGELEDLPVRGTVVGAVFDAEGNLLVRTDEDGQRVLSLFGPDNTLKVQATEPATVRDLDLIAYTR
ncbi:hypothetical protein M1L60_23120 [Actinoplanes sp. TRM 88003]|uniref:TolB protein n=1 Tax=Paractinoplanes aksuensis TaxID=2939490 RepID=A0ABT1DU65_9ACTN|nr:hypothetical protein [Actinoplanes aksuensis]MCO8273490.1 hypothetical protein [Actinoplanes aksuensis]